MQLQRAGYVCLLTMLIAGVLLDQGFQKTHLRVTRVLGQVLVGPGHRLGQLAIAQQLVHRPVVVSLRGASAKRQRNQREADVMAMA